MSKPTAPKPRSSVLDLSIGGYVLKPEFKAAIKTIAARAADLDNRRRALLGQPGPSPLGVALVASGLAPPTALAGGSGAPRSRSATAAAPGRPAPGPRPPSPVVAAVSEFFDDRARTLSDNLDYYGDRFRDGIEDGQRWLERRPEVFRENLEYYLPGLDNYLKANAKRAARKVYGFDYDSSTGQTVPRYFPLASDFPQFEPEPKAAYQDRISDSDIGSLMDGQIYDQQAAPRLVRAIDGPVKDRWVALGLINRVGGTYFDPETEDYRRAPGDAAARAAYAGISDDTLAERQALIDGVDRDYYARSRPAASGLAYLRAVPDGWVADGASPFGIALGRTLTGHGKFLPNLAAENRIVDLDRQNHPFSRGLGEFTGAVLPGLNLGNKAKGAGKGAVFAANTLQDFALNAAGGMAASYGSDDGSDVLGKAALDAAVGRAAPEALKFAGDGVGSLARRHSDYGVYLDRYGKPVATISEAAAKYFSQKALDDLLYPQGAAPR